MKFLLTILLASFTLLANAQQTITAADTSKPLAPYLKNRKLPLFALRLLDSSILSISKLPKTKATILIYFNTTCDHCQEEVKQIVANKEVFEGAQIIFASVESLELLREFKNKYNLNGDNFYLGKDIKYFMPAHYQIKFTPFVVVYNKNQMLEKVYEGGAKWQTLEKLLKTL
jgi:thiol-disulfide isomerase/thioredoxin